jgi:hypothetical protein
VNLDWRSVLYHGHEVDGGLAQRSAAVRTPDIEEIAA